MKNNSIQGRFRAAAKYFEGLYRRKKGRGFQLRVAQKANISPPYLNEILKGKKDGPEELRRRLVTAIGSICKEAEHLTYEMFLKIGENIIQQGSPGNWRVNHFLDDYDNISDGLREFVKRVKDEINDPYVQFEVSLCFLLNKCFSGNLEELEPVTNISVNILEKVKAGKVCLLLNDQEKKNIANFFGISFESLLEIGQMILAGENQNVILSRFKSSQRLFPEVSERAIILDGEYDYLKEGIPIGMIDYNLLLSIIKEIESYLLENKTEISAEKKAKLIIFLYDELVDFEQDTNEVRDRIREIIDLILMD